MAQPLPWQRYDTIVASETVPPEGLDRDLFYLVKRYPLHDYKVAPDVQEAYSLYEDEEARHVLNALLLFDAEPARIKNALRLGEHTLEAYCVYFFDKRVFPHVFAARRFLKDLSEQLTKEHREIYELALQEGPERLLDRYRIGSAPIPKPEQVLEEMMRETHSRAFEHRGKPITSKTAETSFRWGRAATATAQAILQHNIANKQGSGVALVLALKNIDHTQTPEEAGLSRDDIVKE
jgi:hypothetical protein